MLSATILFITFFAALHERIRENGVAKKHEWQVVLRMLMFFSCFSKHDETNDIRWQILTCNASSCAVHVNLGKRSSETSGQNKKTIDCMNNSLLFSFAAIKTLLKVSKYAFLFRTIWKMHSARAVRSMNQ